MSRAPSRVELTLGYVLHRRPYRDTSLILELFTREHGRLTAFARGARGLKPRFGALQPFAPLLLSWRGRGEAPQLAAAERAGYHAPLPSARLLPAFYLTELLLKLTHRHDPQPEIYDLYAAALGELAIAPEVDWPLRRFEFRLLMLLGYGLDVAADAGSGRAIEAAAYYHFEPASGLVRAPAGGRGAASGAVLLALGQEAPPGGSAAQREARDLMRQVLDHCLDGRALSTRAVARAVGYKGAEH